MRREFIDIFSRLALETQAVSSSYGKRTAEDSRRGCLNPRTNSRLAETGEEDLE